MKRFLILPLFLISGMLPGQNPTWTYFPPPLRVVSLAARNNTILAGTAGAGIVRFDTLFNRTYFNSGNADLPSDTVLQVAIDAAGDWWVQYPDGIAVFDGSTWQSWPLDQTGLPPGAVVRALKPSPDSSLYVATDNGVAIFENGAWTLLNTTNSGLPSNNVWDVAFHPDGKIYFATSTAGLVEQNGSNWTSFTSANTGIAQMTNVFSVAITTAGTVWLTAGISQLAQIRLAKFEQGVWTGYTASNIGITTAAFLRKLTADSAGRLWLTTSSTVSLFENQGWTHYYLASDIACESIGTGASAPAVAGDGQVWIPTCDVSVFDGQEWRKPATGLPGPTGGVLYNGIAEDQDGNIWIGAEFGAFITKFDGNEWERYYPSSWGASGNSVYSVQGAQDGSVWFGLDDAEILKYENGDWTFFDTCATIFTNHFTLASTTAPNGDQWFSFVSPTLSNSGLAKYSGNDQWQFFTQNDFPDLQNTYIKRIVFDQNGTGWFATGFKGIFKYSAGSWEVVHSGNSGLPDDHVWDLDLAPDGTLWACTDSGIARFDGQNWTALTTANSGLPSNITRGIAFDQAGGMYVGYFHEIPGTVGPTIAVLRQGEWSAVTPPGWENTVNESPDAFIVDSQNRLWFAEFTGPGVYRYDPMLVNVAEPAPEAIPLKISPNPCNELCFITLEKPAAKELRVRLYNTVGQLVLDDPAAVSNDQIITVDMRNQHPGLYRISIWEGKKMIGVSSVIKH